MKELSKSPTFRKRKTGLLNGDDDDDDDDDNDDDDVPREGTV